MKKTFSEYNFLTEKEIKEIWENSIFIFDTNVLLNLYRYSNKTNYKLAVDKIKIKDSKLETKIFHVCVDKAGSGACDDINNSKYHIISYNKPFLIINSQNVAKAFNKTIPNTKESFKIDFYIEGVNIKGFVPASKWGVGIEGFGGVYISNPKKAEFKLQIK